MQNKKQWLERVDPLPTGTGLQVAASEQVSSKIAYSTFYASGSEKNRARHLKELG